MITLTISGDDAAQVLTDLAHLTNGFLAGASQVVAQTQRDPVMPELRGHLAEASEVAAAAVQADPAATVDDKPRRTRRTKEQIAADEAAAAAKAAAEGNVTDTSGPSDSDGSAPVEEAPAATIAAVSASDTSAPLDFDKDVAPIVLGLVKTRGKPWVLEVLSQFGVKRASELPADRWPELVTALEDADAA